MSYDLEPWKRPTGILERVVSSQPSMDGKPSPGAPTSHNDKVDLEYHRLEAEFLPLSVDREFAPASAWQYNPSLCVHKGQLVACVRLYIGGNQRENVVGRIADDWTLTDQRMLKNAAPAPPFKWLPGFEDLRLFSMGGRLRAVSSVCGRTNDGRMRAVAAVLDLDDELKTITDAHFQESRFAEKNWIPIVHEDGLRFIYQIEPTILLRYDEKARAPICPPPGTTAIMRGGSQLLALPDGRYLACVHENRAPVRGPVGRYVHRFVLFDRFLQLERKSEMFVFKETGIEFCAGMALWRDKLVLSFGLQDKQAWLAVTTLEKALETVGHRLPVRGEPRTEAVTMAGAAEAASPDPPREAPVQYDLEPQKRPRAPDETKIRAEAAKTVAAFRPPHDGLPSQDGPPDEELFTKIIPGLGGWCSVAKSRRLAALVADRNTRSVVEIGVFGGRSLLALGAGARRVGAAVVGIDPYTQSASLQGANSAENDAWWKDRSAGGFVDYEATYKAACAAALLLPRVAVVRAASLDVAVTYGPGTVDVLHIDGNHSEETSCADVRAWLPKLSLGAIVVMDDVGWETTKKAQALLARAGVQEIERIEEKAADGRITESWAVYQCVGGKLKG